MRGARLALVAIVALVLLPTAASAATPDPTPSPTAGPGSLLYAGTISGYSTNPLDGTTEDREPEPAQVSIDCGADGCVASGFYATAPIQLVDGEGRSFEPSSGSACGRNWRGERTQTVTATAAGIHWVYDTTASTLETCSPGNTAITWAGHYEFDGELVAGDPCVLDASCAVPVGSAGAAGPREVAAPTALGGTPTVADAVTPANLLWAAVGTVVLALLIAVPTHFFNQAAETLSERIRERLRRRTRRPESADAAPGRRGWLVAGAGVLAAAVLSSFADPAFAVDAAGMRVFLSILASFAIEVCLGWLAVVLLVRRTHPELRARPQFAPLSLLLVAAAVVLTRVSGFEPAIVFGLVAGVAFAGLAAADRARVVLIGLGWSFAIGALAWIGYSALPADVVVARELLASAAIAGLSTLPIALLPLRGLAGRTVWEASRRVWAAAYAIGLFAFLLVLLPLPASWAEVGFGLWAWIGLYLLYALTAVGGWLAVVRPWRGSPAGAPTR